MRKAIYAALLCCVICAVAVAEEGAAQQKPRNIILIGWDGAQRNHVKECLKKEELPNLKKLAEEGKMVDIDIYGATDTKAGWSEILTGYGPEKTGVYSNGRYQPIPEGYSVFERVKKEFGKDFFTAAVIGKKAHCGECDPPKKVKLDDKKKAADKAQPAKADAQAKKVRQPKGQIVEENGVRYRIIPGSPYYHTAKNTDVWIYGLTLDEKVGTKAIELIEANKDKPFFFFVHFAEVDQRGHKSGENSNDYTDALISNDKWTGKIIAKLKELGLYDKTLVYVTADHGFDEGGNGHGNAPYVFLATNDKAVSRNGRRDDITPTILKAFGLDLGKTDPALDGRPLTQEDDRPKPTVAPGRPGGAPRKARTAPQKQQPAPAKKAA